MKISLSLVSLAALAAAACAHDTTATTTTTTDVTLGANAHLQQLGLVQEAYHVSAAGIDFNDSDDLGGTLTLGGSASTGHGGDGSTTFSATATATSTLDSPDYAAAQGGVGYDVHFQGYRFYVTLKNLTGDDQAVSFHVKVDQSSSGSAASPYGLGTYDALGNPTHPGTYAESDFFGGVVDKSTDDASTEPNVMGDFRATTLFGTSVANPTYSSSGALAEYDAVYTLPAFQIHTYEILAVSEAITQFNPVPEPASFAALAVGALALLRRRRK